MCAIIDTYVGTVVAMVFGWSVMGTPLCSFHLHLTTKLPPNNTITSPTSHSHNTPQQHINILTRHNIALQQTCK